MPKNNFYTKFYHGMTPHNKFLKTQTNSTLSSHSFCGELIVSERTTLSFMLEHKKIYTKMKMITQMKIYLVSHISNNQLCDKFHKLNLGR